MISNDIEMNLDLSPDITWRKGGWLCSWVAEYLDGMCEALGSASCVEICVCVYVCSHLSKQNIVYMISSTFLPYLHYLILSLQGERSQMQKFLVFLTWKEKRNQYGN